VQLLKPFLNFLNFFPIFFPEGRFLPLHLESLVFILCSELVSQGLGFALRGSAMAMLQGAPALELRLRTRFTSCAALPVASKDVAFSSFAKVRVPQLAFQDLSASSLAGSGEKSHHNRRCRVYSTSSSSASASSALQQQVNFCRSVLKHK
jgi:hypothetical protein